MYKRILLIALLTTAISNVHALEIGKPISAPITITSETSHGLAQKQKQVYLMNIKLTPAQQQSLMNFTPKTDQNFHALNTTLPSSTNLGMNGVPVLDQGPHGTCVTFASAAAIDAVLGKGDYVSPLCQLELGNYLENEGYFPSGWDGSYGPWVLDQMFRFGIVSKDKQTTEGCAGIKDYPMEDYRSHGNTMTAEDYKSFSEDIDDKVYASYLMSFEERMQSRFSDHDHVERAFIDVKKALASGNRVTIGTFLVMTPYCNVGACAKHHVAQDTWALTNDIETPPYGMAGHEMVIIGYDDNAIAVDGVGKKHRGLLTLRNSWGVEAGDKGNYYMTYDYFKKFVGELQIIQEVKD